MIRPLLIAFVGCTANKLGSEIFSEDDSLSLLQFKAVSKAKAAPKQKTNSSRARNPGDRERQTCPHEIEEIAPGSTPFGCRGRLQAPATKECSFWGEPHFSRSWPSQFHPNAFDVLYKPGLFRMAAAADGSWEIQVMNCGQYGGAMAARFGKNVIEVVPDVPGFGTDLAYYVNGELYQGGFPMEQGELFVDNTHRKWRSNQQGSALVLGQQAGRGACIDDPGGQIYVEVFKDSNGNINMLLEAADGSFTTADTDGFSLCNVELSNAWKMANWPVRMVEAQDSLFIGAGTNACNYCKKSGWAQSHANHRNDAEQTCSAMAPTEFVRFTVEQMCQAHFISLDTAQAACVHLQEDPVFFQDCQLDFCAADGDPGAVATAEDEEHNENPQPVCAIADDVCDPASACCNALKDEALLNFGSIMTNNLCGDGNGPQELRYGNVLTQNGQSMDMVVTSEDHDCGRATNAKNGARTDELGIIAVQAGREATFTFAFVKTGTDEPVTPTSLLISFLDLDQGKKNKQRQSVEVCGAVNAIVKDNTELEQSKNGDCIKFTSTTWGTGKDNPDSPENLSKIQAARVAAYQIAGSSFSATLGVSKGGHSPRKFLFAGHPSVACVLKPPQ